MTRTAEAIIIGAGVIGAATAFELAKSGLKTLSIDRNAEAGHGSTSGSCAIIRVHYSTLDGTALAYEGYFYWRDWEKYLGVADERGLGQTGISHAVVGFLAHRQQVHPFLPLLDRLLHLAQPGIRDAECTVEPCVFWLIVEFRFKKSPSGVVVRALELRPVHPPVDLGRE